MGHAADSEKKLLTNGVRDMCGSPTADDGTRTRVRLARCARIFLSAVRSRLVRVGDSDRIGCC